MWKKRSKEKSSISGYSRMILIVLPKYLSSKTEYVQTRNFLIWWRKMKFQILIYFRKRKLNFTIPVCQVLTNRLALRAGKTFSLHYSTILFWELAHLKMSEEILHVGQDLPAAGTRAVQQPTRLYAAKHVRFYGPIFFISTILKNYS